MTVGSGDLEVASFFLCPLQLGLQEQEYLWSRVQLATRPRGKCSFSIEMTSGDKVLRMMENSTFKRALEEGKVTLGQGVGVTTRVGSGV